MYSPRALSPEQLRWTLPPGLLSFETTEELKPLAAVIGQASAMLALRRGVEMKSPGFNVFVVGILPTGRLGTVKRILDDLAPRRRKTRDLVYVPNFREPARPRLLSFPPGRGVAFRKEMVRVAGVLVEEIPRILRSDSVRRARDREEQSAAVTHHGALGRVEAHATRLGFAIVDLGDAGQAQLSVMWQDPSAKPGDDSGLHGRAEFQVLVDTGKVTLTVPAAEVYAQFELLEEELATALEASHEAVTETVRRVAEAEQAAIREGTKKVFADLGRRWSAGRAYLAELHDELVDAPEWFDEEAPDHDSLFQAFTVNVIHQGSRSPRAPVVVVANPTWQNLIGGIEGDPGGTDHRSIRGGALVDADGGFLVVNAADILQEPGAWKVLKRALTFGEFDISNPDIPGRRVGGAAPPGDAARREDDPARTPRSTRCSTRGPGLRVDLRDQGRVRGGRPVYPGPPGAVRRVLRPGGPQGVPPAPDAGRGGAGAGVGGSARRSRRAHQHPLRHHHRSRPRGRVRVRRMLVHRVHLEAALRAESDPRRPRRAPRAGADLPRRHPGRRRRRARSARSTGSPSSTTSVATTSVGRCASPHGRGRGARASS